MEVLGLILIVVLFMIGIFLLVFFGRPRDTSYTVEYNQKLVESFVSVLPDVSVDCAGVGIRISELVRACSIPSGLVSCAGDHAGTCALLKTALGTTLENSLQKWGYDYNFSIDSAGIVLMNDGGMNCAGKLRKVAAEQPLPITIGGEPALLRLRTCFV
jgi:hypothetical protein